MTDHGAAVFRAPLESIRVSVLWKADVYETTAERAARVGNTLSMQDVADTFNDDLGRRASSVRFDLTRLDDPALKAELATVYSEATPRGALRSALADA